MKQLFKEVYSEFYLNRKTVLSDQMSVNGFLTGDEDMIIEGRFHGEIKLNGQLYISKSSYIKANIQARSVIVYGEVDGNIDAEHKIDVKEGSVVYGDMEAPHIVMEDGARVHGKVNIKD